MNKPTVIEIPENANEQVVRIQLDEVAKTVKNARLGKKDRITVTIHRGQ